MVCRAMVPYTNAPTWSCSPTTQYLATTPALSMLRPTPPEQSPWQVRLRLLRLPVQHPLRQPRPPRPHPLRHPIQELLCRTCKHTGCNLDFLRHWLGFSWPEIRRSVTWSMSQVAWDPCRDVWGPNLLIEARGMAKGSGQRVHRSIRPPR